MSTSLTAMASTSHERSPQYSISPAMARSRPLRRLPSRAVTSAVVNARGSRRGVRSRSRDRGDGRRLVWASGPERSPGANHDPGRPFGIGEPAVGSRIAKNSYIPATAARRRLTDAGASRSVRCPARSTTFGPGRPGTCSWRQADKNPSTSSVTTPAGSVRPPEATDRTPPARTRTPGPSVGSSSDPASSPGRRWHRPPRSPHRSAATPQPRTLPSGSRCQPWHLPTPPGRPASTPLPADPRVTPAQQGPISRLTGSRPRSRPRRRFRRGRGVRCAGC